jgi:hypothetical protein
MLIWYSIGYNSEKLNKMVKINPQITQIIKGWQLMYHQKGVAIHVLIVFGSHVDGEPKLSYG